MDEKTEDDVCTALISLGPPVDLMIDATILPSASGRRTSAVVKNFARGYGMPTISTTYSLGYVDPEWKDISESEREWLLHIQPPGDIIPAVVKSVAVEYSMNTAGIFYDSTFGEGISLFYILPSSFISPLFFRNGAPVYVNIGTDECPVHHKEDS